MKKHPRRGGNVIALQIETNTAVTETTRNICAFADLYQKFELIAWFTSDGQGKTMLSGGTLPDVLKTVNFGSGTDGALGVGNISAGKTKMCSVLVRLVRLVGRASSCARKRKCDKRVRRCTGYKFHFYMFCGGTSVSLRAQTMTKNIRPTTSYDYFAPLSESKLYVYVFRVKKAVDGGKGDPHAVPAPEYQNIGEVKLTRFAALFDNLDNVGEKHFRPVLYGKLRAVGRIFLHRTYAEGDYDATQLS
ncbi:MAG: beta-galactosidase [Christensenellaceae bacterium]